MEASTVLGEYVLVCSVCCGVVKHQERCTFSSRAFMCHSGLAKTLVGRGAGLEFSLPMTTFVDVC